MSRESWDPAIRFTTPDGKVAEVIPPPPKTGFLGNGTVVDRDTKDVLPPGAKMEMVGTAKIFVGEDRAEPYRECPQVFQLVIDNGWDCVRQLQCWAAE